MFSPGSAVFQQGRELSVEVNQRALIDSELDLYHFVGDSTKWTSDVGSVIDDR